MTLSRVGQEVEHYLGNKAMEVMEAIRSSAQQVTRGEVPTSRGRQDRKRGATEPCPEDRTPGLPSRRAGQGGWREALQAHTACPRPPANPGAGTGHVAAVGRMGVHEEEQRKGERMLSGNGLAPHLHPQ